MDFKKVYENEKRFKLANVYSKETNNGKKYLTFTLGSLKVDLFPGNGKFDNWGVANATPIKTVRVDNDSDRIETDRTEAEADFFGS